MYPDGAKRLWNPSFLSDKRSFVSRFLKTKFNISPLVYEMICFPGFTDDPGLLARLDDRLEPDRVLFFRDLTDELSLMLKLYTGCIVTERKKGSEDKYDDLTDRKAYSIFFYWESGVPAPARPGRPPMVFMSYNRMNQARALEIKTELENNGIFVWRAPEDVPVGEFYYDREMEAIEACDAFLLLLSSSSQESGEVKKEFVKAIEGKKKIIPIWIEDCKPNEYYEEHLVGFQYRYMIHNEMSVMDEIIQSVKAGR